MAKSQKIVDDFVEYGKKNGGLSSKWYIGIASDPEARLFTDHKVNKTSGVWIHSDAGSEQTARDTEKYLIDTYKTKGDTGGGDNTTTHVYGYLITSTTAE